MTGPESPTAPCCDLHNRNCEPPAELCCERCTEAAHDTFPIRHADRSPCVLEPGEPGWLGASGWADRYTGGRY